MDTTRFRAFCGWNWYFSSFSVSFAYRRRHKEFLYSSILPGFYLAEDYPAQLPPTSSSPKFPPLPSKGNSTPLTEKFISCSLETYYPPVPHVLYCFVLFFSSVLNRKAKPSPSSSWQHIKSQEDRYDESPSSLNWLTGHSFQTPCMAALCWTSAVYQFLDPQLTRRTWHNTPDTVWPVHSTKALFSAMISTLYFFYCSVGFWSSF